MGRFVAIVEVDVEYLAIAAPVAAEVDQDAFVRGGRGFERGGEVAWPATGRDRCRGRRTGSPGRESQDSGNGDDFKDLHRRGSLHDTSSLPQVGLRFHFHRAAGEARDLFLRAMSELRKRLESETFPDLGAMMEGYAQAAAELGGQTFEQKLDFSADSIDALDEILVLGGREPGTGSGL